MEHIFVAGAYFLTDKKDVDCYNVIANLLKQKFPKVNVYTPLDIEKFRTEFIQKNPSVSKREVDKAMVEYDLNLVKNSKLLVVDVSNKSTGVGIELGSVLGKHKNIVFVAKTGSKISDMITGAFWDEEVKYYNFEDDLKQIINNIKIK